MTAPESVPVLNATIVAVAVYPDRARVTRRGMVRLPAGDHRVYVEPLPLGLHADSVRVAGRATPMPTHGAPPSAAAAPSDSARAPATVLGVDVLTRRQPRTTDEAVAALEDERRGIEAELAELTDADGVQAQVAEFLAQLARRSGATFARTVAAGASPAEIGGFADSLAERLVAVRARQREIAERKAFTADRLAAVDRRLVELSEQRKPDRLAAAISLAVETESDVDIELSYVVDGAGWQSAYDVRLSDDALSLTWYGLVSQHTGEDWPEGELTLSTARPAAAASVPELDPWYLDRFRPPTPPPPPRPVPLAARSMQVDMMRTVAAPAGAGFRGGPELAEAAEVTEAVAVAEQGVAAASYRPARPVAVPADGAAHRATVAVLDLTAALDYITAPVRSPDTHLRATVVNTSTHTLLPGRAAVFHGGDFVGTAALEIWAPGEEVELALGVDDRVRVERELVRRTATKVTLGSTRRREVEYRTKVSNHTPRPARVTVLDQLPVSRDDQITVRDVRVDPEPAERTDLGVVTWKLELAAGETREVHLGFRVELAKGVELAGWRE